MIATEAAHAVVFDLDGTLVDSEPNYYEAGRRVLAAHGVSGFSWEEHTRFIGIGTRETLEILRREHGLSTPVDELLAEKNRHYLELARAGTEVFPEMRKLVERLHSAGHPMAVASGSSRAAIDAVLRATSLDGLLPLRVSAEEVAHGKPEPDVFLEAARRLEVSPATASYLRTPLRARKPPAGRGCAASRCRMCGVRRRIRRSPWRGCCSRVGSGSSTRGARTTGSTVIPHHPVRSIVPHPPVTDRRRA